MYLFVVISEYDFHKTKYTYIPSKFPQTISEIMIDGDDSHDVFSPPPPIFNYNFDRLIHHPAFLKLFHKDLQYRKFSLKKKLIFLFKYWIIHIHI